MSLLLLTPPKLCSCRVLGVATLDVVRARTLIDAMKQMDPAKISLLVAGGHAGGIQNGTEVVEARASTVCIGDDGGASVTAPHVCSGIRHPLLGPCYCQVCGLGA